jgi:hypothetical protein
VSANLLFDGERELSNGGAPQRQGANEDTSNDKKHGEVTKERTRTAGCCDGENGCEIPGGKFHRVLGLRGGRLDAHQERSVCDIGVYVG